MRACARVRVCTCVRARACIYIDRCLMTNLCILILCALMSVAFNLIIKIHVLRAHLRNNALGPHHYYYFILSITSLIIQARAVQGKRLCISVNWTRASKQASFTYHYLKPLLLVIHIRAAYIRLNHLLHRA